ncbi:MAG: hypothetical protein ACK42B_07425, partial [Chitinophagaceae bacterium]
VTATASATYEIDDTYLTMEALSFSDDTYYNSIGDKDLKIGFNDYIYFTFSFQYLIYVSRKISKILP